MANKLKQITIFDEDGIKVKRSFRENPIGIEYTISKNGYFFTTAEQPVLIVSELNKTIAEYLQERHEKYLETTKNIPDGE